MSDEPKGSTTAPDLQRWEDTIKPLGMPPVHLWNPPLTGDLDMRIARDGQWFYQGTPIARERMVNLFSRILKREGDAYFLVTPVEKFRIQVDDVPFIATDMQTRSEAGVEFLWVVTQQGDAVRLDAQHPLLLRVPEGETQAVPYIEVRAGLEARFHRNLFYRVIDMAEQVATGDTLQYFLTSGGQQFLVGRLAAEE